MIPAYLLDVKTLQKRARCEASIVRKYQALNEDELRKSVATECEFFGIPEARVPGFVEAIRAGEFIDFHEIGLTLFEEDLEEQARTHPPGPPEKKRLRLPSADDIRRARDLLKKATGREAGVEIILGSDGTTSLKVTATEEARANSGQPGPSLAETDLDRELDDWKVRHGH